VRVEIAIDGGVEISDGAEDAAREPLWVSAEKKFSTALSQEPEVA
jgi:hypothetical protein